LNIAYGVFDTAVGPCAIAWDEAGIAGVNLPEGDEARTRARMRRRFPSALESAPPPEVVHTIEGLVELLRGRRVDLGAVRLDLQRVAPFERRVYALARTIAPGATMTYGEMAKRLGPPQDARAVGAALGRNPFPLIVPCHRVLAAGGKPGGFSAHGGVATKLRLLSIEAALSASPGLFDEPPAASS
jgi:methylated-DNA-[protein]-cysteine S-methyltransferase